MDLLKSANRTVRVRKSRPIRIAIIITQKTDDLHVVLPCFLWRKARYTVDLIAAENKASLMLEMGIHIRCDNIIAKTNFNQYSAAFIPHGNFKKLVEMEKLRKDLQKFVDETTESKRWLFASGNGGCVLKQFELLEQEQMLSVCNERETTKLMGKNIAKQPLSISKNIISCANTATLQKFAFKVIEQVSGLELARKTASAIDTVYKG